MLDEVSKKIQRAGGKALFPYNVVRIVLRAGGSDAAVFERDFFRRFFEEEVRRVWRSRPAGSQTICASRSARRAKSRLTIATGCASRRSRWTPRRPRLSRLARAALRGCIVSSGSANKPELLLQKTRTNIGRLVDVYKSEGMSRRNDLAFAEDNPVNRTVSREHAHIVHDKKTGEYRLFNDRWYKRGNKSENNCGLWIVRDGMGQEVHRDTRGTRLLPGDEIHLGKAVVKFQIR